jgi:DNA-binding winged helix-turn-helix (wHTH) protein
VLSRQSLFFPPFRLDLANEQLWRGAQLLAVRPKTFAVLRYLVEHPSQLVTRDELRQTVWPETVGSERAPKQCIRELRQVLGEETATPRFIETIVRRGWRFIAPLITASPVSSSKFQVPSSLSTPAPNT